jgi:ABC-2 type transport system ATP-binding protein
MSNLKDIKGTKIVEKKSSDVILEIINFSKKYSFRARYAVHNLNFVVNKGEFHGFVGANGAGKTTTIKSIIGAYAKYEGEVLIYGQSSKTKFAKSKIGYIPEAANFPAGFSTKNFLIHMAMLANMKRKDAKHFVEEKIIELGLTMVANRNPNKLSSGQKKKVLLTQALIHKPELIVMDEPAANLDPNARSDFFTTLTNLCKTGISVFISSHILDELQKYIDSLTIIDGGKIVFTGKVKELNENSKNNSKQ